MCRPRNSLTYSSTSAYKKKIQKTCRARSKCVRALAGLAGMIKTEWYNHFGGSNLQHHTDNVWAVPRPPLMSTIPPNMLTNWHKFGFHRPTYTRVLLTALQGIMKREKRPGDGCEKLRKKNENFIFFCLTPDIDMFCFFNFFYDSPLLVSKYSLMHHSHQEWCIKLVLGPKNMVS